MINKLLLASIALLSFPSLAMAGATVSCVGPDDTAVIQAAINATKNGGGIVTQDEKPCWISDTLNMANATGLIYQGVGKGSSHIYLLPAMEGKPSIIDRTNSYYTSIRDIQIGQGPGSPGTFAGILDGNGMTCLPTPANTPPGCTGGYNNVNTIDRAFISGKFYWAGWTNMGAGNSLNYSTIYNYWAAYGVLNSTTNPDPTHMYSQTVPMGAAPVDAHMMTLVGSEVHVMVNSPGVTALRMSGVGRVAMVGSGLFSPQCWYNAGGSASFEMLGVNLSNEIAGGTPHAC